MTKQPKTYHEKFIEAVRFMKAEHNLSSDKDAAVFLDIKYMSLYKILDGSNKPTVEQGISLCNKCGYSANWLFLNKGERLYDETIQMEKVIKELKEIKALLPLTKK